MLDNKDIGRSVILMAKGSKVAYIFPPQGPQHVGMGKDLAEKYSAAKEAFDQAPSWGTPFPR